MLFDPIQFQALPWGIALAGAFAAAISDMRSRRIPNVLTFPLLLAGFLFAAFTGGSEGLWHAGAGCLVMGIPYVLLFVFAGGGAGDAKMMGALGAWLAFPAAIPALVGVALAGGLLSVLYALMRRRLRSTFANLRVMFFGIGIWTLNGGKLADAQALTPEKEKMLAMPYGLAIFTGTLAAAGWVILWGR